MLGHPSTSRLSFLTVIAALVCGCGGDTSSFSSAGSGGGAGAAGAGGSNSGSGGANTGGSGQSGGGVGQAGAHQGGAGGAGVSGAGGAFDAGTGGGTGTEAGPCPPPANTNDTAICMTFSPENIHAENDPTLDERGVFIVQIFDTPNPPKQNAGQTALFERTLPASSSSGGQIALSGLRPIRAVSAFPPVVYIRAVFVDNPGPFATQTLGYGAWVGGINFNDGIQKDDPVEPVTLTQGAGNAVDIPLTALRKLDVTVHLTATPVGDGQGPLAVVVVNDSNPKNTPPPVGFASDACADVSKGDVHLTGFFVGSGQHWITGVLKDLGGTADLPPGALAGLTVSGQTVRIPWSFTVAPTAYSAAVTIGLDYVVPWPAEAGAPPPNSCADLGIKSDGGP